MRRWPRPQLFIYSALGAGVIGIAMLYGGLMTIAPMFILAFVLLSILAVIATTVADIEHAQAQREARGDGSNH